MCLSLSPCDWVRRVNCFGGQFRAERGFTLVEVMVALAIVAITLPALLMTLYQQADDTAYLRDKTQAQIVAADKLTELRLRIAKTRKLDAAKSNGTTRLAERDWRWNMEIAQAPGVPNFFRVDIRVGLESQDESAALYELAAFISGDLAINTNRSAAVPGSSDEKDPGQDSEQ